MRAVAETRDRGKATRPQTIGPKRIVRGESFMVVQVDTELTKFHDRNSGVRFANVLALPDSRGSVSNAPSTFTSPYSRMMSEPAI